MEKETHTCAVAAVDLAAAPAAMTHANHDLIRVEDNLTARRFLQMRHEADTCAMDYDGVDKGVDDDSRENTPPPSPRCEKTYRTSPSPASCRTTLAFPGTFRTPTWIAHSVA